MNHSEVCASAYSLKAAMNQLCLLATTISENGQKLTFARRHNPPTSEMKAPQALVR